MSCASVFTRCLLYNQVNVHFLEDRQTPFDKFLGKVRLNIPLSELAAQFSRMYIYRRLEN